MKYLFLYILLFMPAIAIAGNPYQKLVQELFQNSVKEDKSIAVAGFSYSDGHESRDGGVVAERVTTELIKVKKYKVLERKEVDKILEEVKFQHSGAISPDSAKEIGKMIGADWVIVGTLVELTDTLLELNARIVRVDSGEILSAASGRIKKDWLKQYKRNLVRQTQLISQTPNDAKAFFERGLTNSDLAAYDNAIADFSMAISINASYIEAYFNRGIAYHRKKEFSKAIIDYSRVISASPDFAEAYKLRGRAYSNNGEYDQAYLDYAKALEIMPGYAAEYNFDCGTTYYRKGDYAKAIEHFSKAIELDSNYFDAYTSRGAAYSAIKEYDNAIADNSRAIMLNPEQSAVCFSNRGVAYFAKGEFDVALKDLTKAIEMNPRLSEAYSTRGSIYDKKGNRRKAIAEYSKTLELNPRNFTIYNNRGVAYYYLGDRNRAIEDYSKALEVNPEYAESYNNRGTAYYEKGEFHKAVSDYSIAIKLNPKMQPTLQPVIDAVKWRYGF